MKQLTSNIMKIGWQQKVLGHRMEDGTLMFEDMPPVVKITREDLISILERSFYAGGQCAIHALVYDAALDEGDEITEADMSKLDALMHELNEYFTKLAGTGNGQQQSPIRRHNGTS